MRARAGRQAPVLPQQHARATGSAAVRRREALFRADDAEPAVDSPEALMALTDARVISRPDGYYWLSDDSDVEVGPFDSIAEALADRDISADDDGLEPGETLTEAEDELGMSTWIDPDTGSLAEGTSTRLEDH